MLLVATDLDFAGLKFLVPRREMISLRDQVWASLKGKLQLSKCLGPCAGRQAGRKKALPYW